MPHIQGSTKEEIDQAKEEVRQCNEWLEKANSSYQINLDSLKRLEKKYNELNIKYGKNIPIDETELLQLKVNIDSKRDMFAKFKPEEVIKKLEAKLEICERNLRFLTAQAALNDLNQKSIPAKMSV